ncbi:IgGFc-binding protein-like [Sardina pilchardus]|uniref:IgGFc-binding protein-like n=1 Tax=Sardina pilchardus TaxID=27697 RepID=UPI002E159FD9
MLCHSINAYVIDCQDVGVKVLNWRTPSLCPLTCPTNSHYSISASSCATPCPGLTSVTCADVSAEGCACNIGYYFNGTGCVPQDECSCYINGKTLKIGETVVADDCSAKYVCPKSGNGHTESMSCTIDETCEIKNGIRGCYAKKCVMGNNGVITTFNGRARDVPNIGVFDLVTICDSNAEGRFRVLMDLQACGPTGPVIAVGIIAFFEGANVNVNSEFDTWVNGWKVSLPFQMENGLIIQVINDQLVIEKKSAVVVSYSRLQEITVTVSESVAEQLCGACGRLADSLSVSVQSTTFEWSPVPFSMCPQ